MRSVVKIHPVTLENNTHAPGKFTAVESTLGEDDEAARGPFLQLTSLMSTIGFRR